jgi:hypothetical protein
MHLRLTKYIPLLAFAFSACNGDFPAFEVVEQDPKLVLQFEVKNGDESIVIGSKFTDSQGYYAELKTFKFYVSDINLIAEDGRVESFSDVELVDFDGTEKGGSSNYQSSFTKIVSKGNYDQVQFSVGLPADLNATDPTTEPNKSPLSTLSGMHWNWADMFVFIMFEAGVDTNSDQTIDGNIAFHTGLDPSFRPENAYPMTFNLEAFAKDTLHVSIDWNKLFPKSGANAIDLDLLPFYHANTDAEALEMTRMFTDNFVQSISVKTN